jgi:hypothetical protein
MKCYDCEKELTKEKEEFGICEPCEEIRAKKMLDEMEEENAQKEMDRVNKEEWQREFSRSGGLKKSEKKTEACRKNASKPRARWVTATYYEIEYRGENSKRGMRDGLILEKGKHDYDIVDNQDKVVAMIEAHAGCKMSALRKFQVIAKKI